MYHVRALVSRARWRPFVEAIAAWLEDWAPQNRELVIIGPSGGYTLNDAFLARFDSLMAYDVDVLARLFFGRRKRTRFKRQNAFAIEGKLSLKPLQNILITHPNAAILFSNVIGQVPLEISVSEMEWRSFLVALRSELNGRTWASYHDRWSDRAGVRTDHLTDGDWTRDLPVRKFQWQLDAQSLHHVDAVFANEYSSGGNPGNIS